MESSAERFGHRFESVAVRSTPLTAESAPVQLARDGARTSKRLQAVQAGAHQFRLPDVRLPRPTGGRPLPEALRNRMEHSFAADFSSVRIHEGDAASSVGALAYTQGTHIHFAPGRYQPDSATGERLIGHELAHVVQQHHGRVAVPSGEGAPVNTHPGLESEADQAASQAISGQPARIPGAAPGVAIQPSHGAVINRVHDLDTLFNIIDPSDPDQVSKGNRLKPAELENLKKQYDAIAAGKKGVQLRIDASDLPDARDQDAYQKRMMGNIAKMMQTESGRTLINALGRPAAKHTTTLKPEADPEKFKAIPTGATVADRLEGFAKPGGPGLGSNTTVRHSGEDTVVPDSTEGWAQMPGHISMFHELVHAHHLTTGTAIPRGSTIPDGMDKGVPEEEYATVGLKGHRGNPLTENAYREQRRQLGEVAPDRPSYRSPAREQAKQDKLMKAWLDEASGLVAAMK
ncbi:eCIS core domain-containing protein [Archangium lansingense]|uniref:eCIS core domain-containing protein n=1 Tax=Archangium lansingense TaxID=2995310 RepID=UPI003B7CBB1B